MSDWAFWLFVVPIGVAAWVVAMLLLFIVVDEIWDAWIFRRRIKR